MAAASDRFETRDLARLAVSVVLHDRGALRAFARHRGAEAAQSERVRETLRQCHVFCGFPRALAALDVLRDAGLRLAPPPDEPGDPADPTRRGASLFDAIYGDKAASVRGHLRTLDPMFAHWIADHAYGRVMTRPGLDARERELIAVALLAALGHERQLASHARGAVRCGADPGEVAGILDAARDIVPDERTARATGVVERFARTDGD